MKEFSSVVSTGSVSKANTCLRKLEHGRHVVQMVVIQLRHAWDLNLMLLGHDFSAE